MYKKASRLKLRFKTKFGLLTLDQLWDIKMTDLKAAVKEAYEAWKKIDNVDSELSFLEGNTESETEMPKLTFEILKDVYTTRLNEVKSASEAAVVNKEIKHLEEILAAKKEESLKSMSVDEIEKLIREKKDQISGKA